MEGANIKKPWIINKSAIVFWFTLTFSTLLTLSLVSYAAQFELNNPLNIKDEFTPVIMVDTPENYTSNLLIIFSDGLRYDKLLEANTPNIDNLRTNGVTLTDYRANLPSYSHVNYVSIGTGSTPNITQVFSNSYTKLVTLPNLFGLVQDNGYSTGIITVSDSWGNLFGDYFDNSVELLEYFHDPAANLPLKNRALIEIPANFSNVQFLGFDDTDTVGHLFGAASEKYIEAIELLDSYIGELLALYDSLGRLNNTTVVLMSDHGMHDIGEHGGITDQETHATLILSGKGIVNSSVTINEKYHTSSLTPTLLTLLGIPLASSMNGKVIYNALDIPLKSKALYSIQAAENMIQQFELSYNKLNLLTPERRNHFGLQITDLKANLDLSKASYTSNDFGGAFSSSQVVDTRTRNEFSLLYSEFDANVGYIRLGVLIGIFLIFAIILVVGNLKFKNELKDFRIFNKKLIIPILIGVTAFVLIHFAMTQYHYSSLYASSTIGLLLPNILAILVGSIVGIFLPWLVVFLMHRKKNPNFTKFKDWRMDFLRSSIGTLLLVTILCFVFSLIYISMFGAIPGWQIPPVGYYYAYMMIGLIASFVAFNGLILTIVLWFAEGKTAKQQWIKEKATAIFQS
ncbi:MAG: alkaline phosphatase family protein [Candidatus Thorarchaeota archaeon]